jgi:glycosyltransferase involved in cell wall biosynthesis
METLDIVIPVYNEEKILQESVLKIHNFCDENLDLDWRIIIADNASNDSTLPIATDLAKKFAKIDVLHLGEKGRGRALKKAWTETDADYRCYMDVDLSSDLKHLPALIDALRDNYDISAGSRLMNTSKTERSLLREVLSRGYNIFIKLVLWTRFTDAQCGFKAVNRRVAEELVPKIRSTQWFFDTELLVLGEKLGYRIMDISINWVEDPDSRVNIFNAIVEDIKGVFGLRYRISFKKY